MQNINHPVDSSTLYVNNAILRVLLLCELYFAYAIIVWTIWYTHLNPAFDWLIPVLALAVLFLFTGSELLHNKSLFKYSNADMPRSMLARLTHARGIGNPMLMLAAPGRFWFRYRSDIIILLLVFGCLFLLAIDHHWPTISSALDVGTQNQNLASLWLLPILLLLTLLLLSFMLRWDTLRRAILPSAGIAVAGMLLVLILYALLRYQPGLPLQTDQTALQKWNDFSFAAWIAQTAGYIFWAWLQQYFFLGVINTSLTRIINTGKRSGRHLAAWTTALLFGLVHLPNIWLFGVTFAIGILFAYSFMRRRNLFALAVAHALVASLYYQLLPLSLAPEIEGYEGPAIIYLGSRAFVFTAILLTFFCLLWSQREVRLWLRGIPAIILTGWLLLLYPDASQGPVFTWGDSGNGMTWRLHNLKVTGQTTDYTEYEIRGSSPYLLSHPLIISPAGSEYIELELAINANNQADGILYPDFGNGFREDVFLRFHLQPGRHTYRIQPDYKQTLFRLKLETDAGSGSHLQLYSLYLSGGDTAG
jgi:membrane protease YdiL (CAAX protease family)